MTFDRRETSSIDRAAIEPVGRSRPIDDASTADDDDSARSRVFLGRRERLARSRPLSSPPAPRPAPLGRRPLDVGLAPARPPPAARRPRGGEFYRGPGPRRARVHGSLGRARRRVERLILLGPAADAHRAPGGNGEAHRSTGTPHLNFTVTDLDATVNSLLRRAPRSTGPSGTPREAESPRSSARRTVPALNPWGGGGGGGA